MSSAIPSLVPGAMEHPALKNVKVAGDVHMPRGVMIAWSMYMYISTSPYTKGKKSFPWCPNARQLIFMLLAQSALWTLHRPSGDQASSLTLAQTLLSTAPSTFQLPILLLPGPNI